jgi:hypothetical protein
MRVITAREVALRTALVVGSIIVALAVLELGCRLWRGPQWLVHWPNIVWKERHSQTEWPSCAYSYNRTLGWSPTPHFKSAQYNVGGDGFRVMPPLPAGAAKEPLILATGDSFTEGDEVSDSESWPAHLQGLMDRRVLNGGVGGFGLDQTVLRTEELAMRFNAGVAVVGFIVDDIRRTEDSRSWDVDKPYFDLQGGELVLHNSPVPPPRAECDSLPFWQRYFGWSVMIDGLARRQGLMVDWIFDNVRALPEGRGRELACPLIERLTELDVPTLVVAQYDRAAWDNGDDFKRSQHAEARRVLDCAQRVGLRTFDTFDVVQRELERRGIDALYLKGHHSPEGNRLIAGAIATELQQQRQVPAGD